MADSFLSSIQKGLFILVGTVSLILGFIGIFVPVLPTTPLILLAAACYLRGSKKLHRWITNNERFGPMIRDYQSGKGLKKSTKIKAISLMWIMILTSAYFFVESIIAQAAMILTSIAVTIYLLRLPLIKE
jgi:uncharacterized membrane protein YbaN (DUF454 family)